MSKDSKGKSSVPKRASSSYFHYANEQRPIIQKKHPEMKITEIAKELGAGWKKVTGKEKERYEALAAQDKARYEKEKDAYIKKHGALPVKSRKSTSKKEEGAEGTKKSKRNRSKSKSGGRSPSAEKRSKSKSPSKKSPRSKSTGSNKGSEDGKKASKEGKTKKKVDTKASKK